MFVVLRLGEDDARAIVTRHLVEIGAVSNVIEAVRMVAAAPIESVAVIW